MPHDDGAAGRGGQDAACDLTGIRQVVVHCITIHTLRHIKASEMGLAPDEIQLVLPKEGR